MMDMMEQTKKLGAEVKQGVVKEVKPTPNPSLDRAGSFQILLSDGQILEAKSVIVATGAGARWMGLSKEKEFIGKGVCGCATCDGIFFKDKVVAMIGGGNTACEEASFLAKIASKVYMIHRRDEFRASPAVQKKIVDNPKVEILWNTEVVDIGGGSKVESLKVKNNKTGEERVLTLDGIFVAIGRTPATEFVKGVVEMGEDGHIIVGKNTEYTKMNSVEGIFAAGDCSDAIYRQAIVAAGDGAKAAIDVERWLDSK